MFIITKGCAFVDNTIKYIGEIAKYLDVQRTIMKEKGCTPLEIAQMSKEVCEVYGIPVPDCLVDEQVGEQLQDLCVYEYHTNLPLPERTFTDLLKRVYIVEFGNYIKIGFTKNVKQRMQELQNMAQNYGGSSLHRLAFTRFHTNYSQNEIKLHSLFNEKRVGTGELFQITFEEAFEALRELELKDNSISKLNNRIMITDVFN